jgi:hypothetical protein
MTTDEVDAVLAVMTAHWTTKELTEEEIATWERHLAGFDFAVGFEAAERLIDHQRWFPTVSEFAEAARPLARRKQMHKPALPESRDARETYKRRGLAHIRELRERLKEAR